MPDEIKETKALKDLQDYLAVILMEEKVDAYGNFYGYGEKLDTEKIEVRRQNYKEYQSYYEGCIKTLEYLETRLIEFMNK